MEHDKTRYAPIELRDPVSGEVVEVVTGHPGTEAWVVFWRLMRHIIRQLDVVIEQTRK